MSGAPAPGYERAEPDMARRTAKDKRVTIAEAAALVPDGARIGFGGGLGLYRRPVSFAGELVRQGKRDLHLHGILLGIEADLLIGGGCAASTTSGYCGLDELGQAPNWQRAAAAGEIELVEYSEWTLTAAFRATNMGLPYLPWLTSRHNDIAERLGLKEVECPYTGKRLLAVRAVELDVAVIQAPVADAEGNVQVASPLNHMYDVDALIARSATTVVVCAERIGEIDKDLGQLAGREVDAVVEAPRGAWPGGFSPLYGVDHAHITEVYVPAARGGDFGVYLEEHVLAGDPA